MDGILTLRQPTLLTDRAKLLGLLHAVKARAGLAMLPSYQANDDFDLDDTEPSSVKRMLLRENLGGSTSPLNQFWSRLKSPSTRQIAAFACLPAFLCLLGLQRLFGHHSSGTYPQFGKPVDWSGRENYPLRVNWRNRTNQLLTPFKTLTEDQCDNLFQPLYG